MMRLCVNDQLRHKGIKDLQCYSSFKQGMLRKVFSYSGVHYHVKW